MPKPAPIKIPAKSKSRSSYRAWPYALCIGGLALLGGWLARDTSEARLSTVVPDSIPDYSNPCAAFDVVSVPGVSSAVEPIGSKDGLLVFGENHGYSPYTLACIETLGETVYQDKKVAVLLEGRPRLKPIEDEVDFIKTPYEINEASLCKRADKRFSCFGWDDPIQTKKLESLMHADPGSFAREVYLSMRARNLALVETVLELYLQGQFDTIMVIVGSEHLSFQTEPYASLYQADHARGVRMMVPELFQKAIERGYISETELKQQLKFLRMPSETAIQAELGKPWLHFAYESTSSKPAKYCTSDGPDNKRRALKRFCA